MDYTGSVPNVFKFTSVIISSFCLCFIWFWSVSFSQMQLLSIFLPLLWWFGRLRSSYQLPRGKYELLFIYTILSSELAFNTYSGSFTWVSNSLKFPYYTDMGIFYRLNKHPGTILEFSSSLIYLGKSVRYCLRHLSIMRLIWIVTAVVMKMSKMPMNLHNLFYR